MQIGIIGGGATGLLIAYYLQDKNDVTLYVRRKEQKALIERYGIHKVNDEKTQHVTVKLVNDLGKKDLIVLCVKSNQINDVMTELKKKKVNSPLLFLQNGMGHIHHFNSINNSLYIGVIEHGVVRENDYTFHHRGIGQIKIAVYHKQDPIDQLVDRLETTLFPFEIVDDWNVLLKEKLIVNAVINPLTALFNVKNKAVIENKYIRKLAFKLCQEVARILNLKEDISWRQVTTIAKKTGENRSSMRNDILTGRETEVEAILGYIVNRAKKNEKDAPFVKIMYDSIRALEERNNE